MKTLEECQKFWDTKLTDIFVPTVDINARKNAPIGTYIAMIISSGGEDPSNITRIITATDTKITRISKKLQKIRNIKSSKVTSDIKKLLKYNSFEFKYNDKSKDIMAKNGYFVIKRDLFTTLDLRLAHYLLENYTDSEIQVYLVLKWKCTKGWTQVTQEQLAEAIGLSKHSYRKIAKILKKLIDDDLIEKRSEYQSIVVVDKETGVPKNITKPYFEYKLKVIEELEENED